MQDQLILLLNTDPLNTDASQGALYIQRGLLDCCGCGSHRLSYTTDASKLPDSNSRRITELADYTLQHFANVEGLSKQAQETLKLRFAQLVDARQDPYAQALQIVIRCPSLPETTEPIAPSTTQEINYTLMYNQLTRIAALWDELHTRVQVPCTLFPTESHSLRHFVLAADHPLAGVSYDTKLQQWLATQENSTQLELKYPSIRLEELVSQLSDDRYAQGVKVGREEAQRRRAQERLEPVVPYDGSEIRQILENARERGRVEGYNQQVQQNSLAASTRSARSRVGSFVPGTLNDGPADSSDGACSDGWVGVGGFSSGGGCSYSGGGYSGGCSGGGSGGGGSM